MWQDLSGEIDLSIIPDFSLSPKQKEPTEQTIQLPKEFISLANKTLPYSSIKPLTYLKERGIKK